MNGRRVNLHPLCVLVYIHDSGEPERDSLQLSGCDMTSWCSLNSFSRPVLNCVLTVTQLYAGYHGNVHPSDRRLWLADFTHAVSHGQHPARFQRAGCSALTEPHGKAAPWDVEVRVTELHKPSRPPFGKGRNRPQWSKVCKRTSSHVENKPSWKHSVSKLTSTPAAVNSKESHSATNLQ